MNLASLEDKGIRARRAIKGYRAKSEHKDSQAQVDQEALWELWDPKETGAHVGNLVTLVLVESKEAQGILAKEAPSVKPGQQEDRGSEVRKESEESQDLKEKQVSLVLTAVREYLACPAPRAFRVKVELQATPVYKDFLVYQELTDKKASVAQRASLGIQVLPD